MKNNEADKNDAMCLDEIHRAIHKALYSKRNRMHWRIQKIKRNSLYEPVLFHIWV